MSKREYWVMFQYGGNPTVCEKRRTIAAAVRAARACERRGGVRHYILRVEPVERTDKPVRVRVKS